MEEFVNGNLSDVEENDESTQSEQNRKVKLMGSVTSLLDIENLVPDKKKSEPALDKTRYV